VAIGQNSVSSGVDAIAIGRGATATGSVAVGAGAFAQQGGAAFGDGARATGSNATALGPFATASALNSVAIGVNSVASTPNSVPFGTPGNERRLMNVAPAILPTDAPNLSQVKDLISGTVFNTQIRPVQAELRRGIAATAALPSVFMPSAPGRSAFAMNGATFAGESARGFPFAHRLNVGTQAVLTAGYASAGYIDHVGRIGFAVEF
jgi:autotransporter adhesin